MKLKLFLQFFLIFSSVITSGIFFYEYYKKDEKTDQIQTVNNELEVNIIKDIKYYSRDNNGNIYEIFAESGIPVQEDDYLIELKKVQAEIIFDNNQKILISSDLALYNQDNYDTEFKKNVSIIFNKHTINCDNLKAFFSENIAKLSGNLVYKNLQTELVADVMEIDLLTKSTKTYMLNNNEKVKINYITK